MSNETYTYDEILAAFKRQAGGPSKVLRVEDTPHGKADALVRDIEAHRDPELSDGDIVIDNNGELWQYSNILDDQGFYVFGVSGKYSMDGPPRPIRKVDISKLREAAK